MARRALVVLVLASLLTPLSGGCQNRDGKLRESDRLTQEGERLRQEGFESGNTKRLRKGDKMVAKGKRMRESALSGM
jgi:hypothetical protein